MEAKAWPYGSDDPLQWAITGAFGVPLGEEEEVPCSITRWQLFSSALSYKERRVSDVVDLFKSASVPDGKGDPTCERMSLHLNTLIEEEGIDPQAFDHWTREIDQALTDDWLQAHNPEDLPLFPCERKVSASALECLADSILWDNCKDGLYQWDQPRLHDPTSHLAFRVGHYLLIASLVLQVREGWLYDEYGAMALADCLNDDKVTGGKL